MKKFIQFQETVGKTAEKIIPTNYGYIVIYDESYCKFQAKGEEDYGYTSVNIEEKAFDFDSEYEIRDALNAGIIDENERDILMQKIEEKRKRRRQQDKEQKLALIQQLQKELGIK